MNKNYIIFGIVFLLSLFVVHAALNDSLTSYYTYDTANITASVVTDQLWTFNGTTDRTGVINANGIIGQAVYGNQSYNTTSKILEQNVWTINSWLKVNSSQGTNEIVLWGSYGSANACAARLYAGSVNGRILIMVQGSTAGQIDVTNTSLITPDTWAMYTVTKNASNYKLYFNGVLAATGSVAGACAVAGTGTQLMSGQGTPANKANAGLFDEYGFWNGKELSATEILQLYNGGIGFQYPFTTASTLVYVTPPTPNNLAVLDEHLNYTVQVNETSSTNYNYTNITFYDVNGTLFSSSVGNYSLTNFTILDTFPLGTYFFNATSYLTNGTKHYTSSTRQVRIFNGELNITVLFYNNTAVTNFTVDVQLYI